MSKAGRTIFGARSYRPNPRQIRQNMNGQERDSQHGRTLIVTLDAIEPSQACRIAAVRATGDLRRRLLAMGFVPGTPVEMVRAAPLGDPIELRARGYCLSLRRAEARLVDVIPEGA